jgi:hypothetical protein
MKKKKQIIEFSEPELSFPLDENGEYEIPEECKAGVLKKMYPFVDCPKMDDKRYDHCEGEAFIVRDFKVVRENEANYLVSPYYHNSGGTVLDWFPSRE